MLVFSFSCEDPEIIHLDYDCLSRFMGFLNRRWNTNLIYVFLLILSTQLVAVPDLSIINIGCQKANDYCEMPTYHSSDVPLFILHGSYKYTAPHRSPDRGVRLDVFLYPGTFPYLKKCFR
jgi:hypothetical protein